MPSAPIREVGPSDVAAAVPGGAPLRVGPPRGWHLSVPDPSQPLNILATWPKAGTAGTRYVVTLQQAIDRAIGDALDIGPALQLVLNRASGDVVQYVVGRYGYIPLIIEEPERRAMAFATHIRTTMSGTFISTGGEEEWTCGTSWSSPGNMPDTIPDAAMAALYTAAESYFAKTEIGVTFSPNARLESVEYAVVRPDGKIGGGQVQRFFGTARTGLGATEVDFALSYCVTLDAGGARGGRYGRFYPPPQTAPLSGGRAAGQSAAVMLDHANKWMIDINAVLNGALPSQPVALCVASQLNGGGNRNVEQLRVGRVPDHQSRRRRGLAEEYFTQTWPPA